jgi:hypothetical protein
MILLVFAATVALGGKPTPPQQVEGVSPWVEEAAFAESSIPTIFDSWDDADMERVVFQGNDGGSASVLAVDSGGTIYTLVRAFSATRDQSVGAYKTMWWGIVAYDPANGTGETVAQETLVYPDGASTYDPDDYEGRYFVSVSVAPADAGPLHRDRLIVLRRSQASGVNTVELVQIDPATGSTETLHELDGETIVESLAGHLHADPSGDLYLAARSYAYGGGTNGDGALLHLAWNGSTYTEQNLVPSTLAIDTVVTVAPDGSVFTIGEPFGDNDGEILRYDTSAGFVLHATYPQESRRNLVTETSWGFAFDGNGTMWMGMHDAGDGYSGVSPVESNQEVAFDDRIVDIPYQDRAGLAAAPNGDVYVIAGDSETVNGTRQVTWSLYRVREDTSSGGGGNGNGGGGGNGKGKNK